MSGIPESDRSRTSPPLIPGAIDEGLFRNDAVVIPSVPADQDILACSKRLGWSTRTPTTPTKAYSTLHIRASYTKLLGKQPLICARRFARPHFFPALDSRLTALAARQAVPPCGSYYRMIYRARPHELG